MGQDQIQQGWHTFIPVNQSINLPADSDEEQTAEETNAIKFIMKGGGEKQGIIARPSTPSSWVTTGVDVMGGMIGMDVN